jgi:hypothetical protein
MDPPAGAAPAELLYKRDSQAAAWRRESSLKLQRPNFREAPSAKLHWTGNEDHRAREATLVQLRLRRRRRRSSFVCGRYCCPSSYSL